MSNEANQSEQGGKSEQGKQLEKTFTQADMDDLAKKVRGEERRKASEKYADYDALKAKADGAKTAEEQIADLKKEIATTRHEALKARVQASHQISDEDAQLFLTGADEETLTAQAKALAERSSSKKRSNYVPGEGKTPTDPADSADREMVRKLFGRE